MHGLQKYVLYLIAVTTCVFFLLRASPYIIELTNALAPRILVIGLVIAGLRLLWHCTSRD